MDLGRKPLPSKEQVERAALVQATRDWGYFDSDVLKRRGGVWRGRDMLEVGMGAGPHSVSYVEGGARSYVGVDPLVGDVSVRDFRSERDRSIPEYHAFPFTTADIERLYPNIRLYPGLLEEVADKVAAHRLDIAVLQAVSEHLADPPRVIETVWRVLAPGGLLLMTHCNYYSWTGHHLAPRTVEAWDRADAAQNAAADWGHLDPAHPAWSDDGLNRVRLDDMRALIDKYFEIVELRFSVDARARLTPELRRRFRRYSLAELLGRNFYFTARKRDVPLATDLASRQFYHPAETYLADRDYSGEDIAPYGRFSVYLV